MDKSESENTTAGAARTRLMARLAQMPAATRRSVLATVKCNDAESFLSVARSKTGNIFPMSSGQQRLWILQHFEPESSAYNSVLAVRFSGKLSVPLLNAVLCEMEKRHEIFRTSFPLAGDAPVQLIHEPQLAPLAFVDLLAMQRDKAEEWASDFLQRQLCRPFNLAQLPLLRKVLITFSTDEFLLSLTLHHILADEWSIQVLMEEVAELYGVMKSGKASPAAQPMIQYADFAVWQDIRRRSGAFDAQLEYWQKTLSGMTELTLPLDRERTPSSVHDGEVLTCAFSQKTTDWVYSFCAEIGSTLFLVLLTAFQIFLGRWTGQTDVSVGTPVANRNEPMTDRTIGFFVNTVVLRVQIDMRGSFRSLLNTVRKNAIEVFANQEAPFEMVVGRLRPSRNFSSASLFQVIFQTISAPAFKWPDATASVVLVPRSTSKFDLTLFVRETPSVLLADWNYATDLFNRETIRQTASRFGALLEVLAHAPDVPLSEVMQLDLVG